MARLTKRKTAAPVPKLQSSPKTKGKGKKKETRESTSTVAKPTPVEASKEDKDDEVAEEGPEADADNSDEDGSDSDEDEEEDSQDEGVDQEGMERLMELLGEDGLDDFDRAQLESLAGDDKDEESKEDKASGEEEDEEGESSSEAEDEEVGDEKEMEEEVKGNDDAVPLDEVESVDEDAVPKQKLEIDNQVALDRIRQTIQLDPSLPWTEALTVTYSEKIEADVNDDLNRELAFYKQALHGAQTARTLASRHNFPFTRPSDYFAEMVKSDAHMERIRQRLLDESASIKKSEEKRKEREGKKFGKQVQIEKLKEREKAKKEIDERLKNLKRKRKDMLDNGQRNDNDFDVAVEDAISDRPVKRSKPSEGTNNKARMPRHARDKKFGFGGAGRRSKQNTKDSTDNFGPGAGRGKKGKGGPGAGSGRKGNKKPQRPGKSKRIAARNK